MPKDLSFSDPNLFKDVVSSDAYVHPLATPAIRRLDRVPLLESSLFMSPFTKSSPQHGRSMEDPRHVVFTGEPIRDEHDDLYTSFTIKGADCSLPTAEYSGIDPGNLRVAGMLDASTFDRCRQVSEVLREAGVLTEWPILHMRPKQFPDGEGDTGLLAFRKMLYDNYVQTQRIKRRQQINPEGKSRWRPDSVGRIGLIGSAISEVQFGVMYRAGISPIRLWEIEEHVESGQWRYRVQTTIAALQERQPKHFACWPELEALDPENIQDQETYMYQVLPKIMGENLARFHNAGCYHKYLHLGNWTLAGEIVDLDSVRLEAVDGPEARDYTDLDRIEEALKAGAHQVQVSAATFGISIEAAYDFSGAVRLRFLRAYCAERLNDAKTTKLEKVIFNSHITSAAPSMSEIPPPEIVSLDDQELVDAMLSDIVTWQLDTVLAEHKDEFQAAPSHSKLPLEIVTTKVEEFLDNEIGKDYPAWLNPKLIAYHEYLGLMALVANASDITFVVEDELVS